MGSGIRFLVQILALALTACVPLVKPILCLSFLIYKMGRK